MFWFRQGLCFLPAFLVSWSSATFIISFVFAVYRRDIDVIFPYISDTGATPPESCLFGLMTIISAFAGTATVYTRYKLVEKQIEENNLVKPGLNEASLWLGIISCFGMCVVATFQETAVRWAHDLGALLFFSTGIIYIILQSVMSFKVYPYNTSKSVLLVRTGLTLFAVIAFFPTVICAFYPNSTSKMHWHRGDKSYSSHLASSISEWIVAFSFVFYFYTYIDDFKLFTMRVRTECEW
ncbi:DNA damage-regulated autophagy modulator protein 1 isoform X2 [Nothobranchius furzeri]|uniref:DNA-damage regulated autophagy modulator 1 n=1 Tax=Nothobranchius furzeri TaxID=105023 RepID=A0A1A8A8X7_NOTFU|nr:DNA damage-regulated autophagy modulator protein 1 isoform X3 [Nothobranchius furzeri]KAF7229270.1 DNA damage regulated autophagy modulator 1 [Nothobranchius furzeri]